MGDATITQYAPGKYPGPAPDTSRADRIAAARTAAESFMRRRTLGKLKSGETALGVLQQHGSFLAGDLRKALGDLAVAEQRPAVPVQSSEPAPDPADVAAALRRLADKIEAGDPEAGRKIIEAAR